MPEVNNPDLGLNFLIGFAAVVFLILVFCRIYTFVKDFSSELRYINREVQRTMGAERRYWIYMRRRLWLSLIPFIRY